MTENSFPSGLNAGELRELELAEVPPGMAAKPVSCCPLLVDHALIWLLPVIATTIVPRGSNRMGSNWMGSSVPLPAANSARWCRAMAVWLAARRFALGRLGDAGVRAGDADVRKSVTYMTAAAIAASVSPMILDTRRAAVERLTVAGSPGIRPVELLVIRTASSHRWKGTTNSHRSSVPERPSETACRGRQ